MIRIKLIVSIFPLKINVRTQTKANLHKLQRKNTQKYNLVVLLYWKEVCLSHSQNHCCPDPIGAKTLQLPFHRPLQNRANPQWPDDTNSGRWWPANRLSVVHYCQNDQNSHRKSTKSYCWRLLYSLWLAKRFWSWLPLPHSLYLLDFFRQLYREWERTRLAQKEFPSLPNM